jgi:hypothetical protein
LCIEEETAPLRARLHQGRLRAAERVEIALKRTLRVPEDCRSYPLPPDLGDFRVVRRGRRYVVAAWPQEALWIRFDSLHEEWSAVQVGAGGLNALTGEPFPAPLSGDPQNYLVVPEQPWLDGVLAAEGLVRQFVAVSGRQANAIGPGTIHLRVFAPKRKLRRPAPAIETEGVMGIGGGGLIRQKVYPDPFGVSVWRRQPAAEIAIDLLAPEDFRALTGQEPPPSPVSAKDYSDWGLPWFELDDTGAPALKGTGAFNVLKGAAGPEPGVHPKRIIPLRRKPSSR